MPIIIVIKLSQIAGYFSKENWMQMGSSNNYMGSVKILLFYNKKNVFFRTDMTLYLIQDKRWTFGFLLFYNKVRTHQLSYLYEIKKLRENSLHFMAHYKKVFVVGNLQQTIYETRYY